ncbi:MAG TPA: MaoC family dehydratase [Geminicoccaceae bacterium]|nr:MaoC family dehydratase [Geminicoccus sp.]HMU49949.1 MaoC family dehydratase [Geminicoccaceae bacterium]
MRLHLEDLSIGQRFVSRPLPLSADAIKAFGGQFDPQPFHLDEQAAEASFFAGLAASGWHTAALTMRLIVESVPLAGGVIGGAVEVTWPRPTRPGDVLTVESEVVEVKPSRSKPDRGMVTLRSETLNQRREEVQVMTAKLVVPRHLPAPD